MGKVEFENQVIQHIDALRNFALSLTSCPIDSEDLVQETLLKALTKKDYYAPNTNLRAWLFTILKNTFINEYRRRSKVNNVSSDSLDYKNSALSPTYTHTDERVKVAELEAAIEGLNDGLRAPFELAYKGYKYAEIAEMENLKLGTVKSRIHVARQNIQKALLEN